MIAGATQIFTATVTNDSANAGVTWTASAGTITTGGLYTAPAPVTTTSATVTATSKTDTTKSASVAVPLIAGTISLNPISPGTVSLGIGGSQSFTDSVVNDPTNSGVSWSIGSGPGTLTASSTTGVTYNAPTTAIGTATTVTLTAASVKDPTKTTTATISLNPISLNPISPNAVTLGIRGSQAFTDTVTNDGTNSGVSWSISFGPGTLSSSSTTGVTYNAPTTAINPATYAILTATSLKDATKSTAATITLTPVAISLTSASAITLDGNGSQTAAIGASVTGDGTGSGATFVVSGAGGTMSASPVGGNSPSSTYTAPVVASAGTSTITVASVEDPTKSQTVTVTLNPPMSFTTAPGALASGSTGVAYPSTAIAVAGGTGSKTFSITAGSLPTGLTMSSAGVITGTPTGTAGTANFTVKVVDQATTPASISGAFSINVGGPAPVWTAPTGGTLTYVVGTPIAPITLSATGGTGAITYSVNSGTLPQGLQIVGNQVTGTPTAATLAAGNTVNFLATDSATPTPATAVSADVTLIVDSPLSITSGSLATAVPNTAYNQTLTATGGSGTGYTWTVTSGATGANSLATLNLSISSAGVISGTPTATGTANFTVQVTDSNNNTASTSLSVSTSAALSLPTPNPSSLRSAGINLSYSGAINATGGIGGYTWTVNGNAVPTNGSSISLSDGLSVSNTGGSSSLSVSGTPTSTGTVTFTASVKDSTGSVSGPLTYSINVSNVYTVGGAINSKAGCNTSSFSGVTVTINTNPVQSTTTDSNGSFSFSNVPNGTYTITPSINGSNAVFYPATENVTVSSGNLSTISFTATLGYTVSGTVAYTGAQTGQIYLALIPSSNCNVGSTGTSISSPGSFTIRGVPLGTYTLQAFMDNVGDGDPNADNPIGSTSGVSVTTTNVTGVSLTLNDPALVTLTTAPTLKAVSGFNSGAFAEYTPITNSSGVETASYYTFQWSTTPNFANIAGSKRFVANGTHTNVWMLNGLTNGSVYYFRAYGTSDGTVEGPYSPVVGPVTIAAPSVGNTMTGFISFAANATGPLYTGFYDQGTGAFYGQYFASPANIQGYTIQVPSGSDYLFVGIVDQNNDGVIDANDITNTGNGSSQPITIISGPLSGYDLTLPSANGIASVTTQNIQSTSSGNTSQGYGLNFQVNGLIKQPVAVTLVSGPNLITPVDIAICGGSGSGSNCGQGFQISFNLNGTSPTVGDTYTFDVVYSDGTTDTLTAAVTAVLSGFATNLSPQTGSSTTPTFTWTDPANASNYGYQFNLTDPSGNTVWQIPGGGSDSKSFSSATTSIVWGTDPTGGTSTPSVGSLTLNSNYTWQIDVVDSNGNSAVTQVQYQP